MPANTAPEPTPVYVYGVVAAGTALPQNQSGVRDGRLELLECDGVGAVISELPAAELRVRRRDLLAHLRSLEQVFATAVVAPCAFGTVMASRDDVVRRFLAPRRDELRALLDRLEGHVQMNVKAEYREEAVLRDIVAEDAEVARARGRAQALGDAGYYANIGLGELVAARLALLRQSDAAQIEDALMPFAADAVPDTFDGNELLVYKGAFLVTRERLPRFEAKLEELAAADHQRLLVESIGPLPPTAFAALRPEA
jgi:hypothetical protein